MIQLVKPGYYSLVTRGHYLTAPGNITQRPAVIVPSLTIPSVEALWQLKPNKDRSYSIVSAKDELCLGIFDSSLRIGAWIQQQQCDQSDSQKWWIEPANYYYATTFTGIDDEDVRLSEAKERTGPWSWGASVQMLLNYYGSNQSQENIVEHAFGTTTNLPNLPDAFSNDMQWGEFVSLTTQLDDWNVGTEISPKRVQARVSPGPLSSESLMTRLNGGRPILVALHGGSNRAVVITGAHYARTLDFLIVADPLFGLRAYPAWAFLNSVSAYWDISLSGSTVTKQLEASLSARLTYVARIFHNEVTSIPSKTVKLPDGSAKRFYSEYAVKQAVLFCKSQLISELDQSEFAGMKSYVERFFPSGEFRVGAFSERPTHATYSLLPTTFSYLSQRQEPQLGESEFNGIVQKVEVFLSKLIANKKAVSLDVTSTPEGASFVLVAEGGANRSNDTNARVTNVFRGLYKFTLSKEGFRTISRELNLVDESGTSIICKIYQTQAGSCLLK
jgi:hypothetical protein